MKLRRSRMESEMDAELQFHVDARADDLARSGLSREEALRRARREFGGITQTKEACRDAVGANLAGDFLQDLRHGARVLWKEPGFTIVALLSLALGIGANTTVFSIVDGLLLRPWAVRNPRDLASVATASRKTNDLRLSSYPDYRDIGQQIPAFSSVVAYGVRGGFLSGNGRGLEADVEVVSPNYFAALGAPMQLGRGFSSLAGRENRSVVVSYGLWQRYFAGDPALAGKSTLLDGKQFTIVGVAARDFCGLRRGWSPDLWVTTDGWATMVPGEEESYLDRDNRWFELAGRLRPGVRLVEAQAQLQGLAQRLAATAAATNRDLRFEAKPAGAADPEDIRMGAYLMAMVVLVLLISCANVANLLLGQMERRRREMATRRALGAPQARIVRQLLTEGLLLSLSGAALGVALSRLLMGLAPSVFPSLGTVRLSLDGRVLLFTAGVSLLMALLFGLAPALRSARGSLSLTIRGEEPAVRHTGGRLPLRSLLVSGEIALSVILLAGSALLLRSLLYSQRIAPGFDAKKNVLMLSVAPPTLYGYSESQAAALYPALVARMEAVPGVVRASYARRPPLTASEGGETIGVIVPGVQPPPGSERFRIRYNVVAPRYFATLGARVKSGREFDVFDTPTAERVALINEAMAQRFWPGADPVGKPIQVGKTERRIAGVVETGRYVDLHEAAQPYLFLPFTQDFSMECVLLAETSRPPRAFVHSILEATASLSRQLPIVDAVPLPDYMKTILAGERSMARLLAGLSILGMFLAAVGLYAAISYLVTRRTHDIGVRMALGARRIDVLKQVLAQSLRLSTCGAVAGLAGALAVSRLVSGLLHGISPADPLSYLSSVLVATTVALAATYFPARRAMRIDPLVALRHE
jgi:predicted permease